MRGYGHAFIANLVVVLLATLPANQNSATKTIMYMEGPEEVVVWVVLASESQERSLKPIDSNSFRLAGLMEPHLTDVDAVGAIAGRRQRSWGNEGPLREYVGCIGLANSIWSDHVHNIVRSEAIEARAQRGTIEMLYKGTLVIGQPLLGDHAGRAGVPSLRALLLQCRLMTQRGWPTGQW